MKNAEEAAFPGKRKADLISEDLNSSSLKAPKLVPEEKIEPEEGNHTNHNNNSGDSGKNDSKEVEIDAEEDEDGDYEGGDDEKVVNGAAAAQVDRKGKGILIEEEEEDSEEDDDDDDCCVGFDDSDDESDLSDDPLAEVDLDNILPSRTRRQAGSGRPGLHIANDLGNKGGDGGSDA